MIRALNHDNRFITRWAVDIILQLNVKNFQFFQDKKWYFIIKPLFEAFKEYYLFEKETGLDVSQPPNIVTELSAFLLRCKNATSESHQQIEFFKKVCLKIYEFLGFFLIEYVGADQCVRNNYSLTLF